MVQLYLTLVQISKLHCLNSEMNEDTQEFLKDQQDEIKRQVLDHVRKQYGLT